MNAYPCINVEFTKEQLNNVDSYELHLLETVNRLFELNAVAVTYERVKSLCPIENGGMLEQVCLYDYWLDEHTWKSF